MLESGLKYTSTSTLHLNIMLPNNHVQIMQSMTTPAPANEAVPEMRAMIQHGK